MAPRGHGAALPPQEIPVLWGSQAHVEELLGDRVHEVTAQRRTLLVDHCGSPEAFRDYFKANHGPTIAVYRGLAEDPDRAPPSTRTWPSSAAASTSAPAERFSAGSTCCSPPGWADRVMPVRNAILTRCPGSRCPQQVSPNGRSMDGSFFAVTPSYGASSQRIEYSFAARRGTVAPTIPPPPTHPAGPPSVAGKYDLHATFPPTPQPVRLHLNDAGGELWGQVYPGTFGYSYGWVSGRYAAASGALFLTEHTFSWPGALFVGSTGIETPGRINGTYNKFEHITPPANGGGVNSGDHRRDIGLWEPMAYTWSIDT